MTREHWSQAFRRIKAEVEADMPEADEGDQFEEYRRRCELWKWEHRR